MAEFLQHRKQPIETGVAFYGDVQQAGGFAFRIYFNPLVRFIWIGAVIMFIGGAVSLSDRRLRVGAPVKAKRRRIVSA